MDTTKLKREKRAKICMHLVIIQAQVTVNKDNFISSIVLSSNAKSDRFLYIAFDPLVANIKQESIRQKYDSLQVKIDFQDKFSAMPRQAAAYLHENKTAHLILCVKVLFRS